MKTKCLIIVSLLLTLTACSKGPVVATVDGEKLTSTELVEKMKMERSLYDPAILSDEDNFASFRRQALDSLIQEAVLLREAKRLGLESQEADGTQAIPEIMVSKTKEVDRETLTERGIDPKKWREAQHKRAMIRKLIEKEVVEKVPISEENIGKYYRKHIGDFRENTRFHARQILVDKKENADRLYVRLMNGEDFAKVAKESSVSPDAARGGDLGFFDAKAYPEVFAEICQELSPGEISKVKVTPYGYQIFQLIARRPPRQRPLEEVKDYIRRKLQEAKVDELFKPWLDGLMQKAQISVNENELKEVRLNG